MASTLVCFERYRSELNLARARRLAEQPPSRSPFARFDGGPERTLDMRQRRHRRLMLQYLQRQSSAG